LLEFSIAIHVQPIDFCGSDEATRNPGRSMCFHERVTLDKTAPLKLVPQIVLVVGVTFLFAAVDSSC